MSENQKCQRCGVPVPWGSGHTCGSPAPSTPRIATSVGDLRIGQKTHVVEEADDGVILVNQAQIDYLDHRIKVGRVVLILSDPPPEKVRVSQEVFDRLARDVDQHRQSSERGNDPFPNDIVHAARALVDEVRRAEV